MTAPGSLVVPQPGWWVRTDRIGTNLDATYGWSTTIAGGETPVGHWAGGYGWSSAAHGLSNARPQFVGASTATSPDVATNLSWVETIPTGTTFAILWVNDYISGTTTDSPTATLGGQSMTLTAAYDYADVSGTFSAWILCFTLTNPPTGSQTITVTSPSRVDIGWAGGAYYSNVGPIGTPITHASGGSSMSMNATSTNTNYLYAQCFASMGAPGTITAYGQTQRSPSADASAGTNTAPIVFGDAPGNGSTLTFSATQSNTTYGGGGIILPLLPPSKQVAAALAPVPVITASAAKTRHPSAVLPVTPNVAASALWTAHAGAGLSVTPAISAQLNLHPARVAASKTVTPVTSAGVSKKMFVSAAKTVTPTISAAIIRTRYIAAAPTVTPTIAAAATVASSPVYISGGSAQKSVSSPKTFSETVPSNAKLAIVWVATDDSSTAGTHTVTLGGNSMTLTSNVACSNVAGFFANLYCFTLLNPPTGSQSIVVTRANLNALETATAYYSNVTSLGTPITANHITTTSMSISATSTNTNYLYAQAFSALASATNDSISSYSQTQRSPSTLATSSDGTYDPLVFGDAAGNGGTLTFTATQSSGMASQGGGAIIVPLIP